MPLPLVEDVQAVAPASEVAPLLSPVKSSSQKLAGVEEPDVTDTDCWAVHPLAGLVTVAVYVPGAVTVGFFALLLKLFGPVQLYEALGIVEFTFSVTLGKQARVPPGAVISGGVLFSGTVIVAEAAQPEDKVAVTIYCPPAFTTGFCWALVKPLGPAHDQAETVLLAVADNCAVDTQVNVPFTAGVTVTVPVLEVVPVALILSKK